MVNGSVTGGATGNFVVSTDGTTLYLAGSDGALQIYDAHSGALVKSIMLGTQLGAIDISPDGSFLLITEQHPILFNSNNPWWENKTVSAVYRVDTATGAFSTLTYESRGSDYTLADVSITAGGTAIFSQNILPGWSGSTPLVTLNLATGVFAKTTGSYYQGSLTSAPDGRSVLIAELNLSSAQAYVLSPTATALYNNGIYNNDVYGYAQGIEAYSGGSGRVAISTGGSLHLWNATFGYIANLSTALPQLGAITGLSFSGDGSVLFALSSTKDTIFGIRMSDRAIVETIVLPDYNYTVSRWGEELALSPDGKTFYISTTEGILAASRYRDVDATADFNGDGRSDVLLQSATTGAIRVWLGQADGKLVEAAGVAANVLDASWNVAGIGDFNGDARDDVLWRHSSGVIGQWSGQTEQFTNNSGVAANQVDNSWRIAGVADYNGDGRDDILWRHSSGEIGQWLAQPNGSFSNNGGAAANLVDPSWTVVASGDFNGDDKDDILWRHTSGAYAEWQGSATGKLNNVGAALVGASGSIVGSGDVNGDGRDDILIRNPITGLISLWSGQASGQFIGSLPSTQVTDLNWKIVAIGDYNGDGRDDLIWLHSSGQGTEWLATATGDFVHNGAIPIVETAWQIQSPDIWLV